MGSPFLAFVGVIILSLFASPCFSDPTNLLKDPRDHFHPEVARKLVANYSPKLYQNGEAINSSGKEIFELVEGVSIDKYLKDEEDLLKLDGNGRLYFEAMFFHLWAGLKLSKNGYNAASFKEFDSFQKSLLLFTRGFYQKETDRSKVLDHLTLVFERLFAKSYERLGSLNQAQLNRIKEAFNTFPQIVGRNLLGPALNHNKVENFDVMWSLPLTVIGGAGGLAGSLFILVAAHADALPGLVSSFLLPVTTVSAAFAGGFAGFQLSPPKSAFFINERFKLNEIRTVLQSRCGALLGRLGL